MGWLQIFQVIGVVYTTIKNFIAGKPITDSVKIGAKTLTSTAVELPTGPVAPYQVISGTTLSITEVVFMDITTLASGGPINIAVKVNVSWYGLTFTYA